MDYTELDTMIELLVGKVHERNPHKGHWSELWALVRNIGVAFKGIRYPSKAAREEAWMRFQGLCDEAKRLSSEASERKDRSGRIRSEIEVSAARGRPNSDFEQTITDFLTLPISIIEKVVGKIMGCREKTQFEEARDELLSCSNRLKEAWQAFNEAKGDLIGSDKVKCYDVLNQAQEKLNEAWAKLKGAQAEARETRRDEFEARTRERILKLESKLENARSARSRQQTHLEDLEDKLSSARSDSFRDRCSQWIDEANERMRDIESSIERMEGWLDEEQRKLW